MNFARIVSSITLGGVKALGKAASASGSQMVKNFKYKPEGVESSASTSRSSSTAGSSSNNATYQMSLDEAHLILNVKKEDPMDVIQRHYDQIFAANGPPPEPAPGAAPAGAGSSAMKQPTQPTRHSGPKRKAPTHSHYLQSKVYRALERIKAERGEATGMETKDAQDPAVNAAEALGAAAAKVKEGAEAQR